MALRALALRASEATAPDRGPMLSGLLTRVLTSLVLIPLFVWLVLRAHDWLFAALVCLVAALALWELLRLFEHAGLPTYRWLGLAAGVGLTASFAVAAGGPAVMPGLPVLVLFLGVAAVLAAPVARGERPRAEAVALTLLGLLYVGWLLGHALLLHGLPGGAELILLLVGVTWTGETAAYVVGSTLGRHRLAPVISPRKTIEGAAGQLLVSVLAAALLAAWLLPDWSLGRALGAGVLLGAAGQVGDLAESALKRSAGVKDAGGLLPGHGGVLDRIDGLLFNVPALYYYVRLGGGA